MSEPLTPPPAPDNDAHPLERGARERSDAERALTATVAKLVAVVDHLTTDNMALRAALTRIARHRARGAEDARHMSSIALNALMVDRDGHALTTGGAHGPAPAKGEHS